LKLVALTGAGISKASGIPTFVEMGDLRNKLSRDYLERYPEDFYKTLLKMKDNIDKAKPNDGHIALVEYDIPIITMNIDGLHSKAGSKDVIDIHGNFDYIICRSCNKTYDFEYAKESIRCHQCNQVFDVNIVLYGDMIPRLYEAIDLISKAQKLLVIGTSFYTSTAGYLTDVARRNGIPVDIINENAEREVRKYLENVNFV